MKARSRDQSHQSVVTPRLRVAHFIIARQLGGAERLVTELLRHPAGRQFVEPYLILQRGGGFYDVGAGVEQLSLEFDRSWRSVGPMLSAVRRLRRFLRERRIDVLHSHWWLPDLIGAVATMGTRVRHVAHLHAMCDLYMPPHFRIRRQVCRTAFRQAGTTVVSCSDACADDFARHFGWSRDSITVLPNAVDVDSFQFERTINDWRLDSRPLRVGIAGRLTPIKGHAVLLEAISRYRSNGGRVRLQIAGEGESRPEIETLIHQLDLSECVELLGPVVDMPAFYRQLDILVQPTVGTEGLPMTVLEAMSSGCLIVASDTGGVREALRDTPGRLLPPGDPNAISECLLQIHTSAPAWLAAASDTMVDAGRSRFGLEMYINRLDNLYSHLTDGQHR